MASLLLRGISCSGGQLNGTSAQWCVRAWDRQTDRETDRRDKMRKRPPKGRLPISR